MYYRQNYDIERMFGAMRLVILYGNNEKKDNVFQNTQRSCSIEQVSLILERTFQYERYA